MTRCVPTNMFKTHPENITYTDHVTNEEFLCQVNIQRLQEKVAERRLRLIADLLRTSGGKWDRR